jgi:glycosyltransferase involved in cell wall biosynthesis
MNDQNYPLISVVIPIKNGAPWLRKTIPALAESNPLAKSTEIIAIDSGSSDETLSILSEYAIEVIQIPLKVLITETHEIWACRRQGENMWL